MKLIAFSGDNDGPPSSNRAPLSDCKGDIAEGGVGGYAFAPRTAWILVGKDFQRLVTMKVRLAELVKCPAHKDNDATYAGIIPARKRR